MGNKDLKLIVAAALLGCLAGCAQNAPQGIATQADSTPIPIPQRQETVDAQNAYNACLVRAARYADNDSTDPATLAALIAPMCYPQFSALEATAAAGLSDRDRNRFDHGGDQRQVDLASDAIRRERGQAAQSDER